MILSQLWVKDNESTVTNMSCVFTQTGVVI